MDGCPYELWKELKDQHVKRIQEGKPSFDVVKMLTQLFQDIQMNGTHEEANFALGWMCSIYKKKDRTEISNYRPIMLMNTNYKILTKVLAIQLFDEINNLVHQDQTRFIPGRSIYDNIRLASTIINYVELTKTNGAIVALDQEKAYDKIRHDYLWKTLASFNILKTFIKTAQELYKHAYTTVAINRTLSQPFRVTREVH
jgi:reverse transcriptase-like protein